jgi:hypothetical protein
MTDDDHAIEVYSKIAEQIIKEDALVNQRMTWGMSINGALLALLGVGAGLFKDVLPHISTFAILVLCVAAALLSIIGWLVCRWTIKSIQDARKQIRYITGIYNKKWKKKMEEELGLPRPFWGRDLDVRTESIDRWWGDDLFRFISVIWSLIIIACVAIVVFRLLGWSPPADCAISS